MKTFLTSLSRHFFNHKLLSTVILILINLSCEKESNLRLDFVFKTTEIIYYPNKHILMTFNIIPKGYNEPYTFKWFKPDSLKEEGPYSINISSNLMLDFEISDTKNISQRFTYEIKTDTIDSIKYDYRNNCVGTYKCNVASSYNGSTEYFQDTLVVIKTSSFNMLNIRDSKDIKNNYAGNIMTYIDSNGNNGFPKRDFFGYHSRVLFTDDSIHYSVSGPLGFYYTNVYDGIRINQ